MVDLGASERIGKVKDIPRVNVYKNKINEIITFVKQPFSKEGSFKLHYEPH